MNSLKQAIMDRDSLSEQEADELIAEAREELYAMIDRGEDPSDICMDYFGLEPDYFFDLMNV